MSDDNKRRIDQLRDSAGSFQISTPDDDTAIEGFIKTEGRLLVLKGKGIYEVKLADQVDPDRTNINVPNTIQRVLPYGAEEPWVGAVVLTAEGLLLHACAPENVDCSEAFAIVLEIAKDIASAKQFVESYLELEVTAAESADTNVRRDRSVVLPTIENVESKCKEFLQRIDHAVSGLFKIVRLFYPDVQSGGWKALQDKIDSGPKDVDNFSQFLAEVSPFFQLARSARNCVEHPRPEQKLIVENFSVDSSNNLRPPTVEILHPKTPMDSVPVNVFFTANLERTIQVVELMVVFLCARHVGFFAGLPVQVVEFPAEQRRSAHVRYGYGVNIGGIITPIG